jgi:hypothetical protein
MKAVERERMLRYIITGTGRCGTGYAAHVLASAGIPCGHEAVFNVNGMDEYQERLEQFEGLAADSSWLAAPFLELQTGQVLHLVRHPQHVIDSLMRIRFWTLPEHEPYREFVFKHIPELADIEDLIERTAWLYIRWNQLIADRILDHDLDSKRVRVEDGPQAILGALEIEPGNPEALFDDRTYNSRGDLSKTVSLDNLPTALRGGLRRIAYQYGYQLDHPPERPIGPQQIFWAFLLIPAISEFAVDAALSVAMYCGLKHYKRIKTPYMRTDRTRNVMIKKFIEMSRNPNDVLVMLDCDHEHPPNIVERLAGHDPDRGVVGALTFRRSDPYDPVFFAMDENGGMHGVKAWDPGGIYQCTVVGHGAVAVRRWVFDRLDEAGYTWPYYRYEYPAKWGYDQSEDVYFARCCAAAGIHHYCDTGVETPHLIKGVADTAFWQSLNHKQEESV